MFRLLRSESFRLRRRWMPWALLLLVIAAPIALNIGAYTYFQSQLDAIRNGAPQDGLQPAAGQAAQIQALLQTLRPATLVGPPSGRFQGLDLIGKLGSVLLIVLTASVFGNEFTWGTLRAVLARGPAARGSSPRST